MNGEHSNAPAPPTTEPGLTSAQLNETIRQLNDRFENDFLNGKPIPYMGWFWRTVDFDADHCSFGLGPQGEGNRPWIAFMENNKWGYSSRRCDGDAWANIKSLLQAAARDKTLESVRAAWDAIQAIGAELKAASVDSDEHGFDSTNWVAHDRS